MKWNCWLKEPFTVVMAGLVALCCTARVGAETPLDTSFHGTLDGPVASIALQTDGRIIVGGGFTTVNGTARSYLARLHPDGTLDSSFAPQPAQYVSRVLVVDSKIYVAAGDGLRRFDQNGALDWHYPMSVAALAVDAQQRVIIGGQFSRIENQYHRNIARLTSDGVLDSAFNTAVGCCAGDSVDALAVQGEAVLVGGLFQSVNSTGVVSHFARLHGDGALDATFTPAAAPRVLTIIPTTEGRTLRVSESSLVRHLADGSDDPGFAPVSSGGSSEDRFVTAAVDAAGRAVVGGNFSLDGGSTRRFVARFNSDGALDPSFDVSANGQVNAVAVQGNGRVLLGGWFTEVNGTTRVGLVRVLASPSAPALEIAAAADGAVVLTWPAAGAFALETKTLNAAMWSVVPGTPVIANGRRCVTNTCVGAGQLFRLRSL